MYNFILAVIGISLSTSFLYAGISFFNPFPLESSLNTGVTSSEISNYESAFQGYKKMYNVYPSQLSYEEDLKKMNFMIPRGKIDNVFSYKNENNQVAFCFTDKNIAKELIQSYKDLEEIRNDLIISDTCYEQTSKTIDESFSAIAITKWFKR